jgi:hypothetical protein
MIAGLGDFSTMAFRPWAFKPSHPTTAFPTSPSGRLAYRTGLYIGLTAAGTSAAFARATPGAPEPRGSGGPALPAHFFCPAILSHFLEPPEPIQLTGIVVKTGRHPPSPARGRPSRGATGGKMSVAPLLYRVRLYRVRFRNRPAINRALTNPLKACPSARRLGETWARPNFSR